MPKPPCVKAIHKAVGEGNITDAAAEKLLADIDRMTRQRKAFKGYTTAEAMRDIAGELEARNANSLAEQKRNYLLNERKNRDHVADQITSKAGAGEELEHQLLGSESGKSNSRAGTFGNINTRIGLWQARVANSFKAMGDDVHDFFYASQNPIAFLKEWQANTTPDGKPGHTGNALAAKAGKLAADLNGAINPELAAQGARVVELEGFMGSQSWAQHRIKALGRSAGWKLWQKADKELAFKRFSEMETPRWDWEKMTEGGKTDPQELMRDIFDSFWEGKHQYGPDTSGKPGGGLNNRYAKARVVIFKDAESFHAHEVALGRFGDKYALGFMKMMENKARTLALLEDWGPGGRENVKKRIELAQQKLKDMPEGTPGRDKGLEQMNTPHYIEKMERMYDMVSGLTEIPDNMPIAMLGQGARSFALATTGGFMLPNSIADVPVSINQMTYSGASMMDALGKRFQFLFKNKKVSADVLHQTGFGSGIYMTEVARTWRDIQMPEAFSYANQKYHNAILMTRWTESGRAGAAFDITGRFGRDAHLPFDKLNEDMQRIASQHDISPAEWDVMRKAVYVPKDGPLEGHKILSHEQFYLLPDEDIAALVKADGNDPTSVGNMRRKVNQLERKYGTMVNERVSAAISEPGGRERWVTTGGGTKAGTPSGEAMRSLFMYKSFLLSVTRRQAGQAGNLPMPRFLARTAATLGTVLVAGYVSMAISSILRGKEPPKLIDDDGTMNVDTLRKAMEKSGYMGLYGNVLATQYDRFGYGMADSLVGPVFGKGIDFLEAASHILPDESNPAPGSAASRNYRMLEQNIPGANIFYIKPALDHAIFWSIRDMLHPGSLHHMERNAAGRGEPYYIKPSQIAPLPLDERLGELGKMPQKAVESLTR